MSLFEEFGKIPRLRKPIVVTEKIDGTNAQVFIQSKAERDVSMLSSDAPAVQHVAEIGDLYVYAGSRNRLIQPGNDNFGFAAFVKENAESLAMLLGEGRHFGEWWGPGIQRGYGLAEKRFSLFNTHRWKDVPAEFMPPRVGVVPVLYEGDFDQSAIEDAMMMLSMNGSVASPGFMRPEGVIVYHTAAKQLFKYTFDDNHKG